MWVLLDRLLRVLLLLKIPLCSFDKQSLNSPFAQKLSFQTFKERIFSSEKLIESGNPGDFRSFLFDLSFVV